MHFSLIIISGVSQYLNDFWSFNVSSGKFKWIGGSFIPDQAAVYNGDDPWPGSMSLSATCTSVDSLYIFGGYSFSSGK